MLFDLLLSLFNKLGIIVLIAFLLSRSGFMQNYMLKAKLSLTDNLFIAIIFGFLGIIGTYSGIPVNGAIANSRSVGVVVAGLFGGPVVGTVAGLIAGIHRILLPTGRFTAVACGLSTVIGGIIAGYAKPFISDQKIKWIAAAGLTIVIEAIQMGIILLISRPFHEALNLVEIIFAPMAFINAFGTGIFMLIIQQLYDENEKSAAEKASLALKIATRTLPILRKGLNYRSAKTVCEIIQLETGVNAVSITNKTVILSHIGEGSDHHLSGREIHTKTTKTSLLTGSYVVANNKHEIECIDKSCKLQSAIVVPLYMKEHIIGTLKLYKASPNSITTSDIELAKGLGYLFSTQIELSHLTYQEEMVAKSELKALQAQIQPHFLFNALNTIISYCRTDALKARDLLTKLSSYLRTSFTSTGNFIPLAKELEYIQNYLSIEEARFSDRLSIYYAIDNTIDCDLPPLILQPLVENALKHGLRNKANNAELHIRIFNRNKDVIIQIQDNGTGMTEDRLNSVILHDDNVHGIGLRNVMDRVKFIYDTDLNIYSSVNNGTGIDVIIPANKLFLGRSSND